MQPREFLPKHPGYLEVRQVPELPPDSAEEEAELAAAGRASAVVRSAPRSLDGLTVEWLLAVDDYLAVVVFNRADVARPARLALQAAELLYKNRHFDPRPLGSTARTPAGFWSARTRFRAMLDRFPGTPQSTAALAWLRRSYQLEHDAAGAAALEQEAQQEGWR